MEIFKNEKGVTLLEVLLSLVILSIVLITILSAFPQMGMMNKTNENKTQAINSANEILVKWKSDFRVGDLFAVPPKPSIPEYTGIVDGYHTFKTTGGSVIIKINPNYIVKSKHIYLHQIIVQVLDKSGKVESETYGYVRR